jgi:hypothetical protein
VLFFLVGWIPKRTRIAHVITVLGIAFSWFIIGIWKGMGYCFLTDWHWQIKEQLGETNLPNGFIIYIVSKLAGNRFSPQLINSVTGIVFAIIFLITVYNAIRYLRLRIVKNKKGTH